MPEGERTPDIPALSPGTSQVGKGATWVRSPSGRNVQEHQTPSCFPFPGLPSSIATNLQTGRLQTTEIYSLGMLDARSP